VVKVVLLRCLRNQEDFEDVFEMQESHPQECLSAETLLPAQHQAIDFYLSVSSFFGVGFQNEMTTVEKYKQAN